MQTTVRIDQPDCVIENEKGEAIAYVENGAVTCVYSKYKGINYTHSICGAEVFSISEDDFWEYAIDIKMACRVFLEDYVYMYDHPERRDEDFEQIPAWYDEEVRKLRLELDMKESMFQEYLKSSHLPEFFSLDAARKFAEWYEN